MPLHKSLTYVDGHVAHALVYADATARNGATGLVAGDVGKIARQTDDDSFWILTDHSPVTWLEVGGGGSGETDHQALTGRTSTGAHPASAVSVDSSGFSGNLASADDDVQKALVTIDGLALLEDIQIPLIAGERSTNLGAYTRLGACIFNKANFPATSYTLKIAAQSDDANEFSVRLYDVTAGAYITGTITDDTEDLAILSLASLTLATGERLYELHAKLNAGSGADAFVRIPAAFIEVVR